MPTLIATDGEGKFRLGPVEEDFYDVSVSKDGYSFLAKEVREVGRSQVHNFDARQNPRLLVKVLEHSRGDSPVPDVKITYLDVADGDEKAAYTDTKGESSLDYGAEILHLQKPNYQFHLQPQ